ncbi:MAG: glycosyltransferase family 9 protein [Burkholderiaceae bacterium]
MHVLIVKHGALGDVVRTSYFAGPMRRKWGPQMRLSWITAKSAQPLLQFHPAIDDLWTGFDDARGFTFDHIFSLDDELAVLQEVQALQTRRLIGAHLDEHAAPAYSDDASEWFDMGLLSRYGKQRADRLKQLNTKGHGAMHAAMFGVGAEPAFHGDRALEDWAQTWIGAERPVLGINPYAGGRWPSKELRDDELRKMLRALLDGRTHLGSRCRVVLLGLGADRQRNASLAREFGDARLRVADTDDSTLRLAAIVRALDCIISSDSLAMHLAIAQRVPTIAFFAPTSAAEIDSFGQVEKVISTASDYCSYKSDADNGSITAERLLASLPQA